MKPKTILVMCRANVGRSPFFAAVLSTLLEGSGVEVFSRGTSAPQVEPYKTTLEASTPTRKMVEKMAQSEGYRNLTSAQLDKMHKFLVKHRSTVVSEADIKKADLILTMEPDLNGKVLEKFPSHQELRSKMFAAPELYAGTILGLPKLSARGRTIKDPVYIDAAGKKAEVPISRERMQMHSQQLRVATGIANWLMNKPIGPTFTFQKGHASSRPKLKANKSNKFRYKIRKRR